MAIFPGFRGGHISGVVLFLGWSCFSGGLIFSGVAIFPGWSYFWAISSMSRRGFTVMLIRPLMHAAKALLNQCQDKHGERRLQFKVRSVAELLFR